MTKRFGGNLSADSRETMLKNLKSKAVLKIIAPVVVVVTGISISWAIVVHKPQPKSELLNDEAPLAQVVKVEPQTVQLNIRSQGVVAARTEIDLVPEVAGQIVELHPSLVAGGFFRLGDVLIKIDARAVTTMQSLRRRPALPRQSGKS